MVQTEIFHFNLRKKSIEGKNVERPRGTITKNYNYNKKGEARYQWDFSETISSNVTDVRA